MQAALDTYNLGMACASAKGRPPAPPPSPVAEMPSFHTPRELYAAVLQFWWSEVGCPTAWAGLVCGLWSGEVQHMRAPHDPARLARRDYAWPRTSAVDDDSLQIN